MLQIYAIHGIDRLFLYICRNKNQMTMKRPLYLLIAACIFCYSLSSQKVSAQTIRNSSGSSIGTIESNGTVRNASGSSFAQFDSDGTVRKNGSSIGKIESDGTVRKNGSSIGKIESDGTVRLNGSSVGKVESDGTIRRNGSSVGKAAGVKKEWAAAAVFFFDFFTM